MFQVGSEREQVTCGARGPVAWDPYWRNTLTLPPGGRKCTSNSWFICGWQTCGLMDTPCSSGRSSSVALGCAATKNLGNLGSHGASERPPSPLGHTPWLRSAAWLIGEVRATSLEAARRYITGRSPADSPFRKPGCAWVASRATFCRDLQPDAAQVSGC